MPPTEQEVNPRRSRILDTPTALLLLAALIFLYPFLFLPPFLPFQLTGDHLRLLAPAQRMFEGELMYRDFFEFVTPGTALVWFFLFKLFGLRLWIPNLLVLVLALGLVWVGVMVAKKVVRPSLALLLSAIFLVAVREFLCDPTHHWYSLLTAMAAIATLMERRTPARIAAAGFFCGLSACFTQTRGLAVVVGLGVFLWWESRGRQEGWRELLNSEAWLVGSFLTSLLAVTGYFICNAGPARFFWCTLVFGLKYYPKEADANTFLVFTQSIPAFIPLRSFLRWPVEEWLFLYIVIPSAFILFFIRYGRESGKNPLEFWERPMLLAIVGSSMLLSVAPAPGPWRMAASEFPALILLGWLIDSSPKLARTLPPILAVGVLLVALHAVVRSRPVVAGIIATPQGKLALSDPNTYPEYVWIQRHTRPLDYYYQAPLADQYFIMNLRNPTPVPFIENNGYTPSAQVAEVIHGLEQHQVHYICWSKDLNEIPDWEDPSDDHLGPLRNYLYRHYRMVKQFPNANEIWEKVEP